MSVWSKLNQPIGKGAQGGKGGKGHQAATPPPPPVPSAAATPPSSRRSRKSRAGTTEPAAAPTAVLDGAGTATAVLELPPPAPPPAAPAASAASRKASASSSLAAVNLLSPWVLEELAVRRLRMRFLAAGIALLVLMAGTWGVLRMHLNGAREELRGDDAVAAGLNKQIKDMSDVRTYVGAVNGRGRDVSKTMAGEVAFSGVLVELWEALPAGTDLSTLTVTLPAEPLTTGGGASESTGDAETLVCPGADPFGSRVVVACIDLTGTARTREQVSRLVEALGSSDLFVEPFVSATTASDGDDDSAESGVEFTGTVGVAPQARSGRYDGLDPAAQNQQNESGEESR